MARNRYLIILWTSWTAAIEGKSRAMLQVFQHSLTAAAFRKPSAISTPCYHHPSPESCPRGSQLSRQFLFLLHQHADAQLPLFLGWSTRASYQHSGPHPALSCSYLATSMDYSTLRSYRGKVRIKLTYRRHSLLTLNHYHITDAFSVNPPE